MCTFHLDRLLVTLNAEPTSGQLSLFFQTVNINFHIFKLTLALASNVGL